MPKTRPNAMSTNYYYKVGDKLYDTRLLRYVSSDGAVSYLPQWDALTPLRGIIIIVPSSYSGQIA